MADFYGNPGLTDIEDLSRRQGKQSLLYGDQAARYADPFMGERGKYQKKLSDLLDDPGSFTSSPLFKTAYDMGLEALNRKGSLRSGNKMAALEKYGQDKTAELYFPQAKLLSDLAMSGSSPAAAGLAYSRGTERSQDQAQMSAAARAANSGGGGASVGGGSSALPWYMSESMWGNKSGGSALPTGGASGGYGGSYNSTYSPGGTFGNTGNMSLAQLNAEAALYGLPARYPSTGGSTYDKYGGGTPLMPNSSYNDYLNGGDILDEYQFDQDLGMYDFGE